MMSSCAISDEETKATLKEVYLKSNYLLDPHAAVGYLGLQKYLEQHPNLKGIFLETAHPVKFYNVVQAIIQQPVPMPDEINSLLKKEKKSLTMTKDYKDLKEYLINN